MHRAPPVRRLASAALACLLLVACGPGGGREEPPQRFFVAGIHAEVGPPETGKSLWGVAVRDADGLLGGPYAENDDGTVTTGLVLAAAPYEVMADGSSTLTLPGPNLFEGWTSQDGSLAIGATVQAGQPPMFLGLVELGADHTVAEVEGDWHLCVWIGGVDGSPSTLWGSVTLDTNGGGTASVSGNQSGTIDGPVVRSVSVEVQADGQFTMILDGTKTMAGAVRAGGDLLLGAGNALQEDPAEAPFFGVLVRKTSAASAATFSGVYQIVGIERSESGYTSVTGSAVPDGVSLFDTIFKKNADETIVQPGPADTSSYVVAADGTLVATLPDPGQTTLQGGISASGDVAVVAGRTGAGERPGFYLLMRR